METRQDRHEERQMDFEEQIKVLRQVMERLTETQRELDKSGELPPTYADVASTASSSTVGSQPSAWMPRFIAIRGFAPFGCDFSSKLTE